MLTSLKKRLATRHLLQNSTPLTQLRSPYSHLNSQPQLQTKTPIIINPALTTRTTHQRTSVNLQNPQHGLVTHQSTNVMDWRQYPISTIPTLITISTHLHTAITSASPTTITTPDFQLTATHSQPRSIQFSTAFHSTRPTHSTPPSTQLSEFEFRTVFPSSIPSEPTVIKEKGSKFINYCHYIENDDDLKAALAEIKSEHPRATHWCYAYRMGTRGEDFRANDDGEPSGSAGMPILMQLQSFDVTNVLVTVVRYYGGTKLGVSGLIKAYKEGAQSVLEQCDVVVREMEGEIRVGFDNYEDQNHLFNIMTKHNAEVVSFDCWDDIDHDEESGGLGQEEWDRQMALSKLHPSLKPPPEPMPRHEYVIKTKVKLREKERVLAALGEMEEGRVSIRF